MLGLADLEYLNAKETARWLLRHPQPDKVYSADMDPFEILLDKVCHYLPPDLTELYIQVMQYEDFLAFVKMTRKLMPKRYEAIMQETTAAKRVQAFVNFFKQDWFDIYEIDLDESRIYTDLMSRGIPLIERGFGCEELNDLTASEHEDMVGRKLLTYLFKNMDTSERMILGEHCADVVDKKYLELVPKGGFGLDAMQSLVEGTEYEPILVWGQIINQCTGNEFLDCSRDIADNSNMPDWDKDNCVYFKNLWAKANQIMAPLEELENRLDAAPQTEFKKLLKFILQRKKEINDDISKETGKTLEEIFDGPLPGQKPIPGFDLDSLVASGEAEHPAG